MTWSLSLPLRGPLLSSFSLSPLPPLTRHSHTLPLCLSSHWSAASSATLASLLSDSIVLRALLPPLGLALHTLQVSSLSPMSRSSYSTAVHPESAPPSPMPRSTYSTAVHPESAPPSPMPRFSYSTAVHPESAPHSPVSRSLYSDISVGMQGCCRVSTALLAHPHPLVLASMHLSLVTAT